MIDESLDTEAMKLPPQPYEFRAKPAWQRLIVMLGGIVVNVIVGVMIFIGITYVYGDTYVLKDAINNNGGFAVGPVGEEIGLKTGDKIIKVNGEDFKYYEDIVELETLLSTDGSYTVDRGGRIIEISIPPDFIQKFNKKTSPGNFLGMRLPPVIGEIEEGTLADRVGLKVGDKFVEFNGMPVKYNDEVIAGYKGRRLDSISFKVQRGAEILSFREPFGQEASIGFYAALPSEEFLSQAEQVVNYGLLESIPMGTKRAFTTLALQIKAFGRIITGVLSPKESLSGPIGIMQAFGNDWDWSRFWSLTGVLSLVLAFMNLLPIPALDGGHVMFLSYEIISRRKPSDKFLETAQKVGMVLLLALMVFIFANDIIKLF
jgi:regulator of sigma E protease